MSVPTETNVDIASVLADITLQTDVVAVLHLIRATCIDLGAIRTSYHITPKLHSQTGGSIQLLAHGFPKKWMELYQDPEFRKHDPIPDIVMMQGEPMRWRDALMLRKLTTDERRFATELEAHGLIDGIGIPLYGQNVRHAYSSFAFENPEILDDARRISTIAALSLAAHTKICSLVEKNKASNLQLSEREGQVIRRIANGRSNKAIAYDLDISPSTADTYVKRVFAKLEVNERTGATIKALELGILKL
ncbi:autoinducer binding domain-containing protein [Parasphingorhabdus sp.]|uniref:helix-turn-helix transcriptional regulator n=1 Tax=Parasphingorhabdus sp. TaxID=2709688 RepID=UPI003266A9D3